MGRPLHNPLSPLLPPAPQTKHGPTPQPPTSSQPTAPLPSPPTLPYLDALLVDKGHIQPPLDSLPRPQQLGQGVLNHMCPPDGERQGPRPAVHGCQVVPAPATEGRMGGGGCGGWVNGRRIGVQRL